MLYIMYYKTITVKKGDFLKFVLKQEAVRMKTKQQKNEREKCRKFIKK